MNLFCIFKTQFSTPDTTTRRFLRTWTPHPGSVLFTLVVVGLVLFVRDVRAFPLGQGGGGGGADVTQTMPYQGYLTDLDGGPVDDVSLDITFRLYDSQSDGNLVGCEEHRDVPIRQGIFQRELGGGPSEDNNVAQCFTNPVITMEMLTEPGHWLGVTVGDEDEMTPRQRLSSVPGAVSAAQLYGTTQWYTLPLPDAMESFNDNNSNLMCRKFNGWIELRGAVEFTPSPSSLGSKPYKNYTIPLDYEPCQPQTIRYLPATCGFDTADLLAAAQCLLIIAPDIGITVKVFDTESDTNFNVVFLEGVKFWAGESE